MGEFFELITADKFKNIIKKSLKNREIKIEKVDYLSSLNRITAEDIKAGEFLPPFSRSTVDGYAVKAADTNGASSSLPAYLDIAGEVEMGKKPEHLVKEGETVYIPTGAMLPEGTDSVVMIEDTEKVSSNLVEIFTAVSPGENVVKKGEDTSADDIIVKKGMKISPRHIGAFAGLGITEIPAVKKPQVVVISTGDELVAADKEPETGEIRDINSPVLKTLLEKIGAEVEIAGIVKDEPKKLEEMILKYKDKDMVLISGGSSIGLKDMTVKVLNKLGKPGVLAHGVAVKPGKPTIFAVLGNQIVFGLPGHPGSSWNVSNIFVKKAVEELLSVDEEKNMLEKNIKKAFLSRNIMSEKGRDHYFPVKLEEESGKFKAVPLLGKSGLISILAEADGVIKVKMNTEGLNKDDLVDVELF
ncbi:MAG: gephyrin-like molybdotransferase Glp [Bacillota bacterium]